MLAANTSLASADFSKGIFYLLVLAGVLIALAAVIIVLTRKKRISSETSARNVIK